MRSASTTKAGRPATSSSAPRSASRRRTMSAARSAPAGSSEASAANGRGAPAAGRRCWDGPMTPLRVGLTTAAYAAALEQVLWSSGVHQNIVFLAMLLQRLPQVAAVSLVTAGGGENSLAARLGMAAAAPHDAVEALDVIIEIGARCDADLMRRFRDRAGR